MHALACLLLCALPVPERYDNAPVPPPPHAAVRALAGVLVWTDCPVPPGLGQVPGLEDALLEIGVAEEWCGPGQCWCGVGGTVLALRERRGWFHGRISLAVLDRLPDADWLEARYAFARAHVAWVEARLEVCPADLRPYWTEWLMEAKWCEAMSYELHYLKQARPWESNVGYLRGRLIDLADVLGRDNLEAGNLPDPAPLHRFRRIDP